MIEQIRRAARFGLCIGTTADDGWRAIALTRISSFFAMILAVALLTGAPTGIAPACAQTAPVLDEIGVSDAIVADPNKGLALFGFDPVAYFIDAQAIEGKAEINTIAQGFLWRFRNEGNRAAFEANPLAYIPLFGGYDPLDLAKGHLVPGRPDVFLVMDGKLLLFRNDTTQAAFAADNTLMKTAAAQWPSVSRGLVHNRR